MKIYKFRPLGTELDFCRAKDILETGRFWCSKFSNLNDPTEGGFSTIRRKIVEPIYNEKNKYKICSFSGRKAFKNPSMWGYYANGFKGISIEIEVRDNEVGIFPVNYVEDVVNISNKSRGNIISDVQNILTTKLTPWKKEDEYRYLTDAENAKHIIGTIKTVYFGNPYGQAVNIKQIYENNSNLVSYNSYKEELKKIAINKNINTFTVKIENCKVILVENG